MQGVDGLQPEYKRTLLFFVCFCMFLYLTGLQFFSPLFRDEMLMGVFLNQLCPTKIDNISSGELSIPLLTLHPFFHELDVAHPQARQHIRRDNP